MTLFTNEQLIKKAKEVAKVNKLSKYVKVGRVGCALVSGKGNIYSGVCIEACCGIGFCAEHSAIAAMVLKKEYRIKKIVSVSSIGAIIPPCGRCRELMYQISKKNYDAVIILGKNRIVELKRLLPDPWQKKFY